MGILSNLLIFLGICAISGYLGACSGKWTIKRNKRNKKKDQDD